jgi:hypothetical protein
MCIRDRGFYGLGGEAGDRHLHLVENGALVIFLIDEVDGETGFGGAALDDGFVDAAAVHALSAKSGKQRWMAIQDALGIGRHHRRGHFSEVTR